MNDNDFNIDNEKAYINQFLKNYVTDIINKSFISVEYNDNPSKNDHKSNTKFYEKLLNMINTQENILNLTGLSKEKIMSVNIIANEQLTNFKENYTKYGKYFKLIQTELALIADNMK